MANLKKMHEAIATIYGLGYFPLASGTVGSLAGLALCLVLHKWILIYVTVFIILFILGVISSGKVEEEKGETDPSCVIIDEFACIFVVFLFVPINLFTVITGFIFYRAFDVLKVPPMDSLEDFKSGWGIMLDDLVAGIYTNVILQVIMLLKGS